VASFAMQAQLRKVVINSLYQMTLKSGLRNSAGLTSSRRLVRTVVFLELSLYVGGCNGVHVGSSAYFNPSNSRAQRCSLLHRRKCQRTLIDRIAILILKGTSSFGPVRM
jgi:hypothetical protein